MHDIKKSDIKSDNILNLRKNNPIRIPVISIFKILASGLFLIILLMNPTAYAPAYGQEQNLENLSRTELEEELTRLEDQIREQQQVVSQYRSQGQTLQGEINRLNAEISSTNLQIRAVELSLQRLDQNINHTQSEINNTQDKIESHKQALSSSIRSLYETDNETIISILLQDGGLSDFFNNINDLLLVQDNIRISLNDVVDLRQQLILQKEELGLERSDVENLIAIRENTRKNLESSQNQKEVLLQVTQNEESRYQQILVETQKSAAQVRSQIFQLIGGGQLNFENAVELAKLAESSTGVRAALTMAILDRESGLGRNVGGCTYDQIVSSTGLPVMHPTRDIPVFKAMLSNLSGANLLPPSPTVSCPILAHGNHGGAVGPAQFIPSTWAIYGGYRNTNGNWRYNASLDYIGNAVGRKPSTPWGNADAFAATSLYIKDLYDSRSCIDFAEEWAHTYPRQESREECASAMYYSGGRWRSYLSFYGIAVVKRANEIQRDIDILSS